MIIHLSTCGLHLRHIVKVLAPILGVVGRDPSLLLSTPFEAYTNAFRNGVTIDPTSRSLQHYPSHHSTDQASAKLLKAKSKKQR